MITKYLVALNKTRRDASSTTTKITQKYTEILYFPIVFPRFVFMEDADGYKQKVLKSTPQFIL